jgi:hypothetical protein
MTRRGGWRVVGASAVSMSGRRTITSLASSSSWMRHPTSQAS